MRVVVIGGSGHIGTFLVPRLVRAGHEVVTVSRGTSSPYVPAPEWQHVRSVVADREQEDRAGTFGRRVADLAPDAVVDLVCFTPESSAALVDALRGRTGHLLHCGSIWRHGPSTKLPVTEASGTPPVGEYGTAKAAIAAALKEESASGGLVTTSLHPGHIVGPGWHPVGPLGNLDPAVWGAVSAGGTLRVPGSGTEAMHHVHADDVARAFELALEHREAAAGEDFTVTAPTALTVRGYAHLAAGWFGREVSLEPVPWEVFRASTPAEHAQASWEHLHRNHVFSTAKARTLLGYSPAHEPEDAVLESVRWLVEHGRLPVSRPLAV
ncbi:NAD-dependent epimerase/dehydratase family protein [Kineococcus indalonis]|uniref:NAD-dependent epimerase/dehydratase family protein n=1 Tax=Kineococcus indalonis TaxID=2696566 RepID=UPI001412CFA3|nr:NAD-dependent epimerase/dehydratase family protein [Kineococcus indalonis]NAZ86018.1 NAD-dependent epimerase/dehydratase family protein [Kineococcus indalonis]